MHQNHHFLLPQPQIEIMSNLSIQLLKQCLCLLGLLLFGASAENVLMTEVFEIKINPLMFNWTIEDFHDQYVYQPSLLDAPDLPDWISYVYSSPHNAGYLYGVPPKDPPFDHVTLEIVALNRRTYETRRHVLPIHLTAKRNPARYEVQMKIDNLNVEDMFEVERMDRLKDVFRRVLWKDSGADLYVTFLESAVELGARLPLNPKEGDGVVIRIGSTQPLSNELIELQEEVRPLWKLFPCPRDLKRTTVERYFRESGFALDWCAFRLLEDNNSAMQQSSSATSTVVDNDEKPDSTNEYLLDDQWQPIGIDDVPERSYVDEFVFTIMVPVSLLVLLAMVLSLILCFHHEGIYDPLSDDYFENIFHICTDYLNRSKNPATSTMIPLGTGKIPGLSQTLPSFRPNCHLSPSMEASSHSPHTSTLRARPVASGGMHVRPSPPPYVRPMGMYATGGTPSPVLDVTAKSHAGF